MRGEGLPCMSTKACWITLDMEDEFTMKHQKHNLQDKYAIAVLPMDVDMKEVVT